MIRKLLLTAMFTAVLMLGALPGAGAMDMPAPGGGPAFGEHVSSRAPEHPIRDGNMFGECVSGMATGDCPHGH